LLLIRGILAALRQQIPLIGLSEFGRPPLPAAADELDLLSIRSMAAGGCKWPCCVKRFLSGVGASDD
jgi:hypothetical protein